MRHLFRALPCTLSALDLNGCGKWHLKPHDPQLLWLVFEGLEVIVEKKIREDHLQLV